MHWPSALCKARCTHTTLILEQSELAANPTEVYEKNLFRKTFISLKSLGQKLGVTNSIALHGFFSPLLQNKIV